MPEHGKGTKGVKEAKETKTAAGAGKAVGAKGKGAGKSTKKGKVKRGGGIVSRGSAKGKDAGKSNKKKKVAGDGDTVSRAKVRGKDASKSTKREKVEGGGDTPSSAMSKGKGVGKSTKKEISAGGLIFRPIKRKGGKAGVEVALISTRGGKRWGLPKGLVEEGENIARTAHREVHEETGLDGRILKNLGHVEYFYTFKEEDTSTLVFKIVYFFLMEYTGGDTADHDAEVDECRWFELSEARDMLRFDDERGIIDMARDELSERGFL